MGEGGLGSNWFMSRVVFLGGGGGNESVLEVDTDNGWATLRRY